jgi:nitrite reductase/ring-hydroxylating ferredoxin subunit
MADGAQHGRARAAAALAPLCAVDEVPAGTARRVTIGGRALAVFNLDGAFHVIDDTCSHGFASLAEGFIDGAVVECPWHGGAFDIRTGAAVGAPCVTPVAVYPTGLRDGMVWADLAGGSAPSQPKHEE